MKINPVNNVFNNPLLTDPVKNVDQSKFGNMLGDFINDVNKSQIEANNLVSDFVSGKDVPLHEVMIAGEKAKTNLELLMEIRNKTVDMYKELTRMQI